MVFRSPEPDSQIRVSSDEKEQLSREDSRRGYDWLRNLESIIPGMPPKSSSPDRAKSDNSGPRTHVEERAIEKGPWIAPEHGAPDLKPINLAPLKSVLESDPLRSKILRVLIEDGGWVTTADLLRVGRQVRSIMGAVTIGTILSGLNDLVSARLILSRSSLGSGIDWAEWRINPDWLNPTRRLLQMLTRVRIRESHNTSPE